jgi:thiamine kinase-like enzyme
VRVCEGRPLPRDESTAGYRQPMGTTIAEVVAEVWPGRAAQAQPLTGGITNSNYRVEVDGSAFVVRLAGERTELLGIDRESEVEACKLAAGLGIGPEIVHWDLERGVFVTRFIEGRPIAPEHVGAEPLLGEIASALRRIHASGSIQASFDTFVLVPAYREVAAGHGVVPRFDDATMVRTLERIAAVRPWQPAALCHNDLLNSNLIHDGQVRIVDWEYAGMGDPFFDLANLAVNHRFTASQEEALLGYYFGDLGNASEPQVAALKLFKLASEAREAMWGVVQMAISTLHFDFEGYAAEHAGGFFEVLDTIDLERTLGLAADVS